MWKNYLKILNFLRVKLILLILFFYLFFGFKGVEALDFFECYNKAKTYDPKYLSIYYEYRASLTLPKQALASLLPQVGFSYSRINYRFVTAPYYYTDYRADTSAINLRQAIFNIPNVIEYKQNDIKSDMSEKKLNYATQELIKRVADAYFEVLYYEEALRVIEEEKRAIFEQLKMIRKLFSAGEATLTDVHDAEARYSSIQFRLIEAEKNLYTAKNNLRRIIGEEPIALARLGEEVYFPELEPSNIDEWIRITKENNNMVKYYSLAKDIAEYEIKKQTLENLPKIDFVAGYVKTNTLEYLKTTSIDYYIFGIQINFNLFSGGYFIAKRREAIERFEQAKKDYESVVSDIIQEVFNNFFGVKTALAQIYAAKTSLRSAEIALESSKKGYKAGIRTVVDVLDAESAVYKAKLDLVKAKYDYIKYLVGLKYYSGVLSEEDVKQINNWLTRR
jgi:TolC family type I secretion outer membrane protein